MPDIKYFSNVQSKSTGDVYVVKDEGAREQIDDIYKYNGEMGAKNLISYPYYRPNHYETAGITYDATSDGIITMQTGTSTAEADYHMHMRTIPPANVDNCLHLDQGTYILSGCDINAPNGVSIIINGVDKNGNTKNVNAQTSQNPNGIEFTIDDTYDLDRFGVLVYCKSGVTISSALTFKPMIRLASDTDETYQPYAKTNRQLTEDIAVPKYDPVDECIYYEGGDQFTGTIDSAPTAGSSNAVSSGGTKTYVDNAIAGVSISGQYAECSTARNVAAKTVTLAGFELKTGSKITVRFTDTGSSNPESGNITLNVNGTGAKEIVDSHSNKAKITYSYSWFYNNMVLDFIYDGTYWVHLNRDNNTTYSSKAAASGGTATSLCTTGEKYTWNNKQNALTFDSAPTQGSGNPVTSGGVFSSLGVPKIDTTTGVMYLEGGAAFSGNIDSTPTAGSNNAVASGGVKTYVDSKILVETLNVTDPITIASQTYGRISKLCTKEGYTPIGIVGCTGSGTGYLSFVEGYISGGYANAYYYNSTSAAKTIASYKFDILYIKN